MRPLLILVTEVLIGQILTLCLVPDIVRQDELGNFANNVLRAAHNVRFVPIPLKKAESSFRSRGDAACLARLSCHWDRHRNQFRELSEVLGGCCEDELVTRTVRPAQS